MPQLDHEPDLGVTIATLDGAGEVPLTQLPGSAGRKDNLVATVNPAVTDDDTAGYGVGSVWMNLTSDEGFTLLDATTGAAIWKSTTASGGSSPPASETVAGIAELATQGETNTGTDDLRIVTPKKLATNPRLSTQAENDALVGTQGTPSSTNKYATNEDFRFAVIADLRLRNVKAGEDWAVAVQPGKGDDTNNGAPLGVYLLDQTIEEGVGFEESFCIPPNAINIVFAFRSRAEVAPAGARTVGVKFYKKGYPDNVAVEAWSAGFQLNDIDIPANEFWQYDMQTVALTTLGLVAGRQYRFEWTRVAPTAGTNLAADWTILAAQGIVIRFT